MNANLTNREKEILELIALGENTKSICQRLNISDSTVEFHRNNIYRKTGTSCPQHLTFFALAKRMIKIPTIFFVS